MNHPLTSELDEFKHLDFLRSWIRMREKCLPDHRDTPEEKKEKRINYDLWRYEYPRNVTKETTKRFQLRQKKAKLERELQALNEELGE